MREHELKTIPPYYDDIESGVKTFEFRVNDRNFQVGDVLVLREWRPDWNQHTGRQMRRQITYVLHVEKLHPGLNYVVLALGDGV